MAGQRKGAGARFIHILVLVARVYSRSRRGGVCAGETFVPPLSLSQSVHVVLSCGQRRALSGAHPFRPAIATVRLLLFLFRRSLDDFPVRGTHYPLRPRVRRNGNREICAAFRGIAARRYRFVFLLGRSEEHTSELQSPDHLVCRLLLEKKNRRKEAALS